MYNLFVSLFICYNFTIINKYSYEYFCKQHQL
jgi:hypothetical protein